MKISPEQFWWFYHKDDNLFRVELESNKERLFIDLPLDKMIEAIESIKGDTNDY